jgi:hypothetical protein
MRWRSCRYARKRAARQDSKRSGRFVSGEEMAVCAMSFARLTFEPGWSPASGPGSGDSL